MHVTKGTLWCAIAAICVQHTANSVPADDKETALELGECQRHLHELVSKLRENAQRKNESLFVEWQVDGAVIIRFDHFSQRMRCEKGILSVDYPGFKP